MIEIAPAFSYPHCIFLRNENAELVITTDVGPRVLAYRLLPDGESLFKLYDHQLGGQNEFEWKIRGGHRFWIAPEDNSLTYVADNTPVPWEETAEDTVALLNPATPPWLLQKELTIRLKPGRSQVTLTHRIRNKGPQPITLAPWGLSVMKPGGFLLLPQPTLGEHPRDLLPNRRMILWPYTDLADPRWSITADFITLHQGEAGPTKLGLGSEEGRAFYVRGQTIFCKRFAWDPDAVYPDMGCNFETFTNEEMLEVESLGPLLTLAPGAETTHEETWDQFTLDTPPDAHDQAAWRTLLDARESD